MAATVMTTVAACKTDRCNVRGEAARMDDGTTLYISDVLSPQPILLDSITVSHGRFAYTTHTDSERLCRLSPSKAATNEGTLFILERGNIYVELSAKTGRSRVSGTTANNELQALNDTVARYDQLLRRLLTGSHDSISIKKLYVRTDSLYTALTKHISTAAVRNKDNTLGKVISRYFCAK